MTKSRRCFYNKVWHVFFKYNFDKTKSKFWLTKSIMLIILIYNDIFKYFKVRFGILGTYLFLMKRFGIWILSSDNFLGWKFLYFSKTFKIQEFDSPIWTKKTLKLSDLAKKYFIYLVCNLRYKYIISGFQFDSVNNSL